MTPGACGEGLVSSLKNSLAADVLPSAGRHSRHDGEAHVVELAAALLLVAPALRAQAGPEADLSVAEQYLLVAANQVGKHAGGHHSGGSSLIVDPWGTVLARADGEKPGHVVAELDFEHQDDVRKRVPLLSHRRPKLYHRSSAQAHKGAAT